MIRRILPLLCLLWWGAVAWGQGATWSVYCNERKYFGNTQGDGEQIQVEARIFARALGVGCSLEGGKVTVNGKAVAEAQVTAQSIMIPLLSTARSIGCKVVVDASTQRIDVTALRGMVPPDIQAAILAAPVIGNSMQMDFLYGIVLDAYDREHLKIYHPVETHWTTLEEVRKRGKDVFGYAEADRYTLNGQQAGVENMRIFIPYGLNPEQTLHSIAHELAHCWQYDQGFLDADARYREGFAEWAAAKVLERVKLDREIVRMTLNTYADYRDGYLYYQALEQTSGFAAVLADMKAKSHKQP